MKTRFRSKLKSVDVTRELVRKISCFHCKESIIHIVGPQPICKACRMTQPCPAPEMSAYKQAKLHLIGVEVRASLR